MGEISEQYENTESLEESDNETDPELEESLEDAREHFRSEDRLKANEEYEVNGYNYRTDSQGRIVACNGSLYGERGERDPQAQREVAREDRHYDESGYTTDDGSHLIATRFNGSGEIDNLVPLDRSVNRGEYKAMENQWSKELKQGNEVNVEIEVIYGEDDSKRPEGIDVYYTVTDKDGMERNEHRFFAND